MEFPTLQALIDFCAEEFPKVLNRNSSLTKVRKVLRENGWRIIRNKKRKYIIDSLDPSLYPPRHNARKKVKTDKIWRLFTASFLSISILLATCLCPSLHRYAAILVALATIIIIAGISSMTDK